MFDNKIYDLKERGLSITNLICCIDEMSKEDLVDIRNINKQTLILICSAIEIKFKFNDKIDLLMQKLNEVLRLNEEIKCQN